MARLGSVPKLVVGIEGRRVAGGAAFAVEDLFPGGDARVAEVRVLRRLDGDDASGDSIENSATIKGTMTTLTTKPPFTPAPQDGFESVAGPTTTVTHFAPIGHESNGSLF
jgi:hypothetical protein